MASTLNRAAFVRLIDEDLEWVRSIPGNDGPASEKGHVIECLKMLRECGTQDLSDFIDVQRAKRQTERHLDKVDPDRTLSTRWANMKKSLSHRDSYAGPDPDPNGRSKLIGGIEELELILIPRPEPEEKPV